LARIELDRSFRIDRIQVQMMKIGWRQHLDLLRPSAIAALCANRGEERYSPALSTYPARGEVSLRRWLRAAPM
jgi:hypothetical protein